MENFFVAGSASALCSHCLGRFQIGGATLPRNPHQPQNRIQVAAAFSHCRWPRVTRSFAATQTLAPPHGQSLAGRHRQRAAQAFQLGRQKDLCPPAPATSPRPAAQATHHHRLVAALWRQTLAPEQGPTWPTTPAPQGNDSPRSQRRVDGGFQRLVSHPRRPTGQPPDRARSLQPFHLGIRLLPLEHAPVQQCFQALFVRYGQPKVIRVDHGAPFAGGGPLDLSRLSAWWLRLGIQVEFTRRACPQDNGAHEQMHRIYKAETATPPAATPLAQQRRSTNWTRYYNHHRPQEALGQQVPAVRYHKSRRRYRGPLSPLRYARRWRTRRVSSRGFIHWRGRARGIGRAFRGENIGLKPVAEGLQEVYFERHLIGILADTDPAGIRPARWTKSKTHVKHP